MGKGQRLERVLGSLSDLSPIVWSQRPLQLSCPLGNSFPARANEGALLSLAILSVIASTSISTGSLMLASILRFLKLLVLGLIISETP
jgi:hypothetical protein